MMSISDSSFFCLCVLVLLFVPSLYGREQMPLLSLADLQTLGDVQWQAPVGWLPKAQLVISPKLVLVVGGRSGLCALDRKSGKELWKREPRIPISWASIKDGTLLLQYSRYWIVRSLDAATGKERWRVSLGEKIHGEMARWGNVVVLALGEANDGLVTPTKIVGLDEEKGTPLWAFATEAMEPLSPKLVGEKVIVKSANGNIYGLHVKSGKLAWTFDVLETKALPVHTLPAEGALSWIGEQRRYVIDGAKGTLLRSFKLPRGYTNALDGQQGNFFLSGRDGYLYAFHGKSGKRLWRRALRFDKRDYLSKPVQVKDCLIVQWSGVRSGLLREVVRDDRRRSGPRRGKALNIANSPTRGIFHCYATADGEKRWQLKNSRLVPGTERVYEHLYTYLGRDGKQHVIDVKLGREIWSWPIERYEGGLPLSTIDDSLAFIAKTTGELVAVKLR